MNVHPTTSPCDREGGQATLELLIVVPVLIALLSLVVYAAKLPAAQGHVAAAAQTAARAATTAHDPGAARTVAVITATAALAGQQPACNQPSVNVDLTRFAPGGVVTVSVTCTVDQHDLGLIAPVGTRQLTATFTSPVDLAATTGSAAP